MRFLLSVTLVLILAAGSAADDRKKMFSGPQPGEKLTPFKVVQVTTAEKSETVELAGAKRRGPSMIIFLHKLTEPGLGLMITLEWFAQKQKGLAHHYVMLTKDKAETERRVKRWWRRPFFKKAAMCISPDGEEGPGRYGLNRNVHMTVLIARDNKVLHNFALLGASGTDAPGILAALAKTIGKPVPKYETIRAELRADRTRRRDAQLKQSEIYKLAPNDRLGRLMLSLTRRERVTEGHAKEVIAAMQKWAGNDARKNASLMKYCKAVLKTGRVTNRYAKAGLEKLAGR